MNAPVGEFDPELEEPIERLSEQVAEARLCLGVQLYVSVDGECVADVALGDDGLGRANRRDTLYALYCTTKPLTVLALTRLVDEGLVGFEDPLGDLLPRVSPRVGAVTLWEILTHTAGLHHHTGLQAGFMGPEHREKLVTTVGPFPRWDRGVQGGYSEYGGWHLLGRVIESVTGEDLRSYVRRFVLEPLGLADELFLGMTPDEYWANLSRIGVNVDMRQLGRVPLLYERAEAQCSDYNPGLGGRGCARGIGRLYGHLADVFWDSADEPVVSPKVLHELTSVHRPKVYDVVLERECPFGLGFMVGLRDHAFGHHCSDIAFGHSGYTGLSCGFADPACGLAVAIVYNGYLDVETSVLFRRQLVSNLIYRAIDAVPPRVTTALPTSAAPPARGHTRGT